MASLFILAEIVIILAPIFISQYIYKNVNFDDEKIKFAVIQPNINPYTEKYDTSLFEKQTKRQIELAKGVNSAEKICIVYPESSFPQYCNEKKLSSNKFIQNIKNQIIKSKNTAVIATCYTYKTIAADTIFYNTAALVDDTCQTQIYHKSKLVLGVEKMPFDRYFRFLKHLNLDFGGYNYSLGTDKKRTVFEAFSGKLKIAPIICYESIYGEFITKFVQNKANCLVIMTNDAWWGNTAGYKQHLMHAQLRAIENRRSVVRAANTGRSCFINAKGEIFAQAPDWTETVLINCISTNNDMSFYAKNGDYIGRWAVFFSLLLLLSNIAVRQIGKPK